MKDLIDDLTPVHGGNDPENMNERREEWGLQLADFCSYELTGTDEEDAISDAISYLLHAARRRGLTAKEALRRAVRDFNIETREG